jgi:hypothetical protein
MWIGDLAVAMMDVIEGPIPSPFIGGRIQAVVLTSEGPKTQELHRIKKDQTGDMTPEQITISLRDVQPYGDPKGKPKPTAAPDLVTAHVLG